MADDPEVQPDETPEEPQAAPEVLPEDTPLAPDNRPARNVVAEVNRKFTKIERQLEEQRAQNAQILASLQQQRQPAPQPAPAQTGAEYSDEQLGQLAAAGNVEALRLLVQRQSEKATAQQMGQFTQVQTVQRALGELFSRYPMLREDTQHPLTQAVYAARNQFLAQGWAPGPATDLRAIEAAIVNAPHLATPVAPTTQDTTRRAGVTAQQTMEGAAPRRSPQSGQTAVVKPLDPKVQGIAQRMNVADPQNSLKRFMDRQQNRRSVVSPAIQQAVREEGQA
jgi:predicted secreted protein